MRMTDLFEKAIAYAQTLEPGDQDHIAETILTDPPLAVIRARLAEADADFAAGNTIDDSDAFFLLDVGNVFSGEVEVLLLREGIIDRLVATVDNLQRGQVPQQIRPVQTLVTPFVDGAENYQRYDTLVAHVAAADLDAMVDMYRRYYPLFQQSYERLGYPNAYFNDRLVEVIDHLLDTPELFGTPELVRPNVLYEYADPNLEDLSSGQKLLLRMGNDHAATIKRVLGQLRSRIASG